MIAWVAAGVTRRCPDCRDKITIPVEWFFGCPDWYEIAIRRAFISHAHENPILHPTVLPGHHRVG